MNQLGKIKFKWPTANHPAMKHTPFISHFFSFTRHSRTTQVSIHPFTPKFTHRWQRLLRNIRTHTHTSMEQPPGAICGSVSGPRTLVHVEGLGIDHWPSRYWTNRSPSWATANLTLLLTQLLFSFYQFIRGIPNTHMLTHIYSTHYQEDNLILHEYIFMLDLC